MIDAATNLMDRIRINTYKENSNEQFIVELRILF
jgi:hypothetical protein